MKKIASYIVVGIIIALIAYYFLFLRNSRERALLAEAKTLISIVENYEDSVGRLPSSLEELNLSENDFESLYYQPKDSVHYIIWYGTSLGESMIYYSDTKEWENGYREIGRK